MRLVMFNDSCDGTTKFYAEPQCSSMYFSRDDYKNDNELFADMSITLARLMSKGMDVKVRDEGVGIVLQWDHAESLGYGNDILVWVTPEEAEDLDFRRREDYLEMMENAVAASK